VNERAERVQGVGEIEWAQQQQQQKQTRRKQTAIAV